MTIEFRVKRVERFIVTRFQSEEGGAAQSARQIGKEFDNFDTAYEVGYALARGEQESLGLKPDDMGVIFPSNSLEEARAAAGFDRPLETYRSENPAIGGGE